MPNHAESRRGRAASDARSRSDGRTWRTSSSGTSGKQERDQQADAGALRGGAPGQPDLRLQTGAAGDDGLHPRERDGSQEQPDELPVIPITTTCAT